MRPYIDTLVRENIRRLKPYASAREDFDGKAGIWLDANENPFGASIADQKNGWAEIRELNRYPDPYQRELKEKIAEKKNLSPDQLFLGNGSDEVLDLLFRTFCEPGKDEVIIMPPTYGMYRVLADIHPAKVREVPLDDRFQPDVPAIRKATGKHTRLLFICSPNNPTGNSVEIERVKEILAFFNGLVIVDEAYIDFAADKSCLPLLNDEKRLVILQTFSKAKALAGIRLGMAFADPGVIQWLNRVKLPYNVNRLTLNAATEALGYGQEEETIRIIVREREALRTFLAGRPGVTSVYPSEANFLLVCADKTEEIYKRLLEKGVVVRLRRGIPGCGSALRITIGTPGEMQHLKEIWMIVEKDIKNV